MRSPALLLTCSLVLIGPARAQVTLDLHALDQGQGAKQGQPATPNAHKAPPAATRRTQRPPPHKVGEQQPQLSPGASAPLGSATAPVGPPPSLPTTPPATLALPTIVVPPPTGKPLPPPTPPVSDAAGGSVAPTSDGVQVLFTPERADLSPESVASLKSYVDGVARIPSTTFNVVAYAAGPPEDPSTPRRLSLSRALAVRSVLMAEGVASERIYVRALGTSRPSGPPDRVDVTALGTNGAEPPK